MKKHFCLHLTRIHAFKQLQKLSPSDRNSRFSPCGTKQKCRSILCTRRTLARPKARHESGISAGIERSRASPAQDLRSLCCDGALIGDKNGKSEERTSLLRQTGRGVLLWMCSNVRNEAAERSTCLIARTKMFGTFGLPQALDLPRQMHPMSTVRGYPIQFSIGYDHQCLLASCRAGQKSWRILCEHEEKKMRSRVKLGSRAWEFGFVF